MPEKPEVPELQLQVMTVREVYDTLTPLQKKMVEMMCKTSHENGYKEGKRARSKH